MPLTQVGGCCSFGQRSESHDPGEMYTIAHELRENKLNELLGCDRRAVLRALGVVEAVEAHVMPVTMDDEEDNEVLNVEDWQDVEI